MFYAVRNGKQDIIEYLLSTGQVNIMREDNKNMNLIQVAAKYKFFTTVEFLVNQGVPCPPDIKRKIERQKNIQSIPKVSRA